MYPIKTFILKIEMPDGSIFEPVHVGNDPDKHIVNAERTTRGRVRAIRQLTEDEEKALRRNEVIVFDTEVDDEMPSL
jgi:hypothetical protein